MNVKTQGFVDLDVRWTYVERENTRFRGPGRTLRFPLQENPRDFKRLQENPREPKRLQEVPRGPKRTQEETNAPKPRTETCQRLSYSVCRWHGRRYDNVKTRGFVDLDVR